MIKYDIDTKVKNPFAQNRSPKKIQNIWNLIKPQKFPKKIHIRISEFHRESERVRRNPAPRKFENFFSMGKKYFFYFNGVRVKRGQSGRAYMLYVVVCAVQPLTHPRIVSCIGVRYCDAGHVIICQCVVSYRGWAGGYPYPYNILTLVSHYIGIM